MTEEEIHMRVAGQLRLHDVAFFHPPNGSKAAPQYRAKLKRLGVSKGVPDLVIVTPPSTGHVGAVLELKKRGGRLSPDQRAWLDVFEACGWATATAYGYDQAIAQLRAWGYVE